MPFVRMFVEPPKAGSITDGDDGEWSGDPNLLAGGGGWRELVGEELVINKRKREMDESIPEHATKRLTASTVETIQPDPIILTIESSDEEIDTSNGISLRGSSPGYGSEGEEEEVSH